MLQLISQSMLLMQIASLSMVVYVVAYEMYGPRDVKAFL